MDTTVIAVFVRVNFCQVAIIILQVFMVFSLRFVKLSINDCYYYYAYFRHDMLYAGSYVYFGLP